METEGGTIINSSSTDDSLNKDDSDAYTGQPCFWCGGGIMLPPFTKKDDKLCDLCDAVEFLDLYSTAYEPTIQTNLPLLS